MVLKKCNDKERWIGRSLGWMEKYMSRKIWDDRSEDVGNMVGKWMGRYGQLHFGMLRSHVNMFGLVFIPSTLKCSSYITHIVQNSW